MESETLRSLQRQETEVQSNIFLEVELISEIINLLIIQVRKQTKRREEASQGSQHQITLP